MGDQKFDQLLKGAKPIPPQIPVKDQKAEIPLPEIVSLSEEKPSSMKKLSENKLPNPVAPSPNIVYPDLPKTFSPVDFPSTPGASSLPNIPSTPDLSSIPHAPSLPGIPSVSDLPSLPQVPSASSLPSVPQISAPEIPSATQLPATPDTSSLSSLSSITDTAKSIASTVATAVGAVAGVAGVAAGIAKLTGSSGLANVMNTVAGVTSVASPAAPSASIEGASAPAIGIDLGENSSPLEVENDQEDYYSDSELEDPAETSSYPDAFPEDYYYEEEEEEEDTSYIPVAVNLGNRECIHDFTESRDLRPTKATVFEYDWTRSNFLFQESVEQSDPSGFKSEIFFHPQGTEVHEYKEKKDGYTTDSVKDQAKLILERARVDQNAYSGTGNVLAFTGTGRFNLDIAPAQRQL